MSLPIALQLYSVREAAEKDLFDVLRRVAEAGYDGVEFAGYYGHGAAEIRKALDDLGLKAEGTHTGIDQLTDDNIGATIDLHHTLGAEFVIVPWLPEDTRNTPDACKATAERFAKITERLKQDGLYTGFHCHSGDMKPLEGGKSAWYLLAEGTPSDFIMQYDTANGMSGGADPVQPIRDFPGRSLSVHLKEAGDKIIGEGPVPWAQVFEACETVGGTKWYVVEEESHSGEESVIAATKSRAALREMGR